MTGWWSTTNVASLMGGRLNRSALSVPETEPIELSALAEMLKVSVEPTATCALAVPLTIGPLCAASGECAAEGGREERDEGEGEGAGEGEPATTVIVLVNVVVPPASVALKMTS